jgi:hypothetical protein
LGFGELAAVKPPPYVAAITADSTLTVLAVDIPLSGFNIAQFGGLVNANVANNATKTLPLAICEP